MHTCEICGAEVAQFGDVHGAIVCFMCIDNSPEVAHILADEDDGLQLQNLDTSCGS